MLDADYLILFFASNDEAVNSLAAEITEISAANKLNESDNKLILFERRFDVIFTSFSSSFKVRYD